MQDTWRVHTEVHPQHSLFFRSELWRKAGWTGKLLVSELASSDKLLQVQRAQLEDKNWLLNLFFCIDLASEMLLAFHISERCFTKNIKFPPKKKKMEGRGEGQNMVTHFTIFSQACQLVPVLSLSGIIIYKDTSSQATPSGALHLPSFVTEVYATGVQQTILLTRHKSEKDLPDRLSRAGSTVRYQKWTVEKQICH